MGADDYMAKPFEPRELVAHIHLRPAAHRRRRDDEGGSTRRLLRLVAGPSPRDLGWRRTRTSWPPLSGADFDLLHALVRNGGKPLARRRIRACPGVADADDRAIDLRVSRACAKKLGDDARPRPDPHGAQPGIYAGGACDMASVRTRQGRAGRDHAAVLLLRSAPCWRRA